MYQRIYDIVQHLEDVTSETCRGLGRLGHESRCNKGRLQAKQTKCQTKTMSRDIPNAYRVTLLGDRSSSYVLYHDHMTLHCVARFYSVLSLSKISLGADHRSRLLLLIIHGWVLAFRFRKSVRSTSTSASVRTSDADIDGVFP